VVPLAVPTKQRTQFEVVSAPWLASPPRHAIKNLSVSNGQTSIEEAFSAPLILTTEPNVGVVVDTVAHTA